MRDTREEAAQLEAQLSQACEEATSLQQQLVTTTLRVTDAEAQSLASAVLVDEQHTLLLQKAEEAEAFTAKVRREQEAWTEQEKVLHQARTAAAASADKEVWDLRENCGALRRQLEEQKDVAAALEENLRLEEQRVYCQVGRPSRNAAQLVTAPPSASCPRGADLRPTTL
jgi:hypothetical protein